MFEAKEMSPGDLGRGLERLRLVTPVGMETLRASVRSEGILSPIAVAELDGRVEVLDGFKRLRVALELKLETVPVVTVRCPSRASARASVLLLNVKARSVTGLDEALVIRALAEEDGLTLAEIGTLLGRDKSFCSRRLKLARDLDPALIAKVRDGSLPVSIATMLAGLPRGNQPQLSATIVREGLSARETERLIAMYAQARGREAEILLSQPRAALGRLERRTAPQGEGAVRHRLVGDVVRATELLARVARGLTGERSLAREPSLAPAIEALRAQVHVLEAKLEPLFSEATS